MDREDIASMFQKLDDPRTVGQTEYRAIYTVLDDILLDCDDDVTDEEARDLLAASLSELHRWSAEIAGRLGLALEV